MEPPTYAASLRFRAHPTPHLLACWDCLACRSVHAAVWPGRDPWNRKARVRFMCDGATGGEVRLRIPRWADPEARKAWRRLYRVLTADGSPIKLAMGRQGSQ